PAAARGAMRSAARCRGRHERELASNELCSSLHHLISGRTVLVRTHIPHACGEESHEGWDPSTTTAIVWPKGGTVIIHPALTALRCDAARPLLAVTHVEHGALRHQPGGEIAPQRHDQLARKGDDRNAPEPLAGVERALEEPAA